MSKRMVATFVAVLMMTLCVSVMLSAKNTGMTGVAEKQTLKLSEPTVIGGTLVPAGVYTVTHEMQGATHVMIFKQVDGKVEVKTACTLVPLKNKATTTEQSFEQNAKNQKVLVEMVFKGDTAKHVLAR